MRRQEASTQLPPDAALWSCSRVPAMPLDDCDSGEAIRSDVAPQEQSDIHSAQIDHDLLALTSPCAVRRPDLDPGLDETFAKPSGRFPYGHLDDTAGPAPSPNPRASERSE